MTFLRNWRRLASYILAAAICLALMPGALGAKVYTNAQTLADDMASAYSTWDGNWNYSDASQCAAFSRYMFQQLYGHTDGLSNKSNQVGLYHAASISELKDVLTSKAVMGDAIRFSACSSRSDTSGSATKTHIFSLVSAGANSLTRYESNFAKGKHNKARLSTVTYKQAIENDLGYTVNQDGNFADKKLVLIKVIHAKENQISGSASVKPPETKVDVRSNPVKNIMTKSAYLSGVIEIPYDKTVTECGVCVGVSANPTSVAQSDATNYTGRNITMWYTVTGLKPNTTYHYRFYAKARGVSTPYYSADATFTTAQSAESAHTHQYQGAGLCSCGATYPLNITNLSQVMQVCSVNSSESAPSHKTPYADAAVIDRYKKGDIVSITGKASNCYGNLWYRLSDGTWINSDYLSAHSHSYNNVGKCSCGAAYPLNITKLSQVMQINKDGAPSHSSPYGAAKEIATYKKGQTVTVTGKANNAYGNLWYRVDGNWIFSDYLSALTQSAPFTVTTGASEVTSAKAVTLRASCTVPAGSVIKKVGLQVATSKNSLKSIAWDTGLSYTNRSFNIWYELPKESKVSDFSFQAGTTYFYRFYAVDTNDTISYGDIRSFSIPAEHAHQYNSVGVCSCGHSFPLSITSINQKMTVCNISSDNTAPAHSAPYGDAKIGTRYRKDAVVTVVGKAKNAYGNLWYKLSNGEWLFSDYLSSHLHSFKGAGKCASCGAYFTLYPTAVNRSGVITAVNSSKTAPSHSTPYGDATIKTRYKLSDTVYVKNKATNAYGNVWYQLNNGEWLASDYVTLR